MRVSKYDYSQKHVIVEKSYEKYEKFYYVDKEKYDI